MSYNLFISHSWAYSDTYDNLVKKLEDAPYFSFKNFSVPKDNPVHTRGTDRELADAISRKMALSNVVLILAGVYSSYSKWINKEIIICNESFSTKKPIIAIEPWASQRTSKIVKDNATRIVKWNTSSIVDAIREVA
ncbi:hypothetical protein SADO_16493 [Salinisphaera dokdonensis CL-ES53]|uniref:Thoeris protein ThsB TIR-like domain-containing protein n=1 Tax=Salinisphaera dokdonensis CL-ES53 TaxID=1304272 RepID=A0ABV2B4Q0_9GAMM